LGYLAINILTFILKFQSYASDSMLNITCILVFHFRSERRWNQRHLKLESRTTVQTELNLPYKNFTPVNRSCHDCQPSQYTWEYFRVLSYELWLL